MKKSFKDFFPIYEKRNRKKVRIHWCMIGSLRDMRFCATGPVRGLQRVQFLLLRTRV